MHVEAVERTCVDVVAQYGEYVYKQYEICQVSVVH